MKSDKTVYFIRPKGKKGPIKIGCSVRTARRLRDIEIWSPVLLEIAATAPGDNRHELALHDRFMESHLHGEWFDANPELIALVAQVAETGRLPPLAIPGRPKDWAERNAKMAGCKKPRRGAGTTNKAAITRAINVAECRAFGFEGSDRRPTEIERIMVGYEGWASPPPNDRQTKILENYIATLNALPEADRSLRSWMAWLAARRERVA